MLIKPFGPDIFQGKLPEHLVESLYQICMRNQDIQSKRRNNLLVGFIEKEFDILPDIQNEILKYMSDMVLEYLNTSTTFPKQLTPIRSRDIRCRASWGNIQTVNEFNPIHNHLMDDIVLVCFPKIDIKENQKYITNEPVKPGTVVFQYGENLQYFGNTKYHVLPKTGDVFIFPASLRHYTYPVYGVDDIRISTSSNFVFSEYFYERANRVNS